MINGTFYCQALKATIIFQNSNDATGFADGSLELDGQKYPIEVGYHTRKPSNTMLQLIQNVQEIPPNSMAAAGYTDSIDGSSGFHMAGAYSNTTSLTPFSGLFEKQN